MECVQFLLDELLLVSSYGGARVSRWLVGVFTNAYLHAHVCRACLSILYVRLALTSQALVGLHVHICLFGRVGLQLSFPYVHSRMSGWAYRPRRLAWMCKRAPRVAHSVHAGVSGVVRVPHVVKRSGCAEALISCRKAVDLIFAMAP